MDNLEFEAWQASPRGRGGLMMTKNFAQESIDMLYGIYPKRDMSPALPKQKDCSVMLGGIQSAQLDLAIRIQKLTRWTFTQSNQYAFRCLVAANQYGHLPILACEIIVERGKFLYTDRYAVKLTAPTKATGWSMIRAIDYPFGSLDSDSEPPF